MGTSESTLHVFCKLCTFLRYSRVTISGCEAIRKQRTNQKQKLKTKSKIIIIIIIMIMGEKKKEK